LKQYSASALAHARKYNNDADWWVGGLDDRSAVFGIGGVGGVGGGGGGGGSSGGVVVWNTCRRHTLTHPSPSRMVIGCSRRVSHTADARAHQFGPRQKRIEL